jgi:nitrogen fixation protein FixH
MKPTKNLWPLGIILTFVLFISGTISLVVMACSQKVDLVSADYYEQEIKFQNHIDQLDRTRHLGRDGTVAYDSAARRIRIALPTEASARAIAGRIQLYRPSAAGLDRLLKLEPDAQGIQFLDATNLQRGLWKVRVSWKVKDQEYFLDQTITVGAGV